ncbi:MAG: hypothetical protein FJ196_05630 [Gammaproteobacteria bacterium]|nr:hypothetical protein [Gammaproteobacteria bacterium]
MADKKDDKQKAPDAAAAVGEEGAPKKKSKMMFFVLIAAGALALIGISVGATLFLTGFFNPPPPAAAAEAGTEKDVAKEGEASDPHEGGEVKPDATIPEAEKFNATYAPVIGGNDEERDFTLNVPNTRRFVQFRLAYKTFYGEKIVENVKKHNIAIGAAILSSVAQFGEEELTSIEGRTRVASAVRDSMNDVLIRNEDFGGIDEVMFTHFVLQ